jgi:hypothetical protein
MTVERATRYLGQVLELEPAQAAEEMLRLRREYLLPDGVVLAELNGGSDDDFRIQLLKRLQSIRSNFWRLDPGELTRQLDSLHNVQVPEIALAARRLRQVAGQIGALRQLRSDPGASGTFVRALTEVLIAPSAIANQIRDREQGWMRPEQNVHHAAARQAIAGTIHHIRSHYPGVYALEETWLNELATYNPEDEAIPEASNILFGIAFIGFAIVTIVSTVGIVKWIFS